MKSNDIAVVRELASKVAEIAGLPQQTEKIEMWKQLNALKPERPMVMIDQVCWNEMNVDDELTLLCTDTECRSYEDQLRKTIYQWQHFPVDMVVEPFIRVPKAIEGLDFGLWTQDEIAVGDPTNGVVGHKYLNQFHDEEDIEKIKIPHITHNTTETQRRLDTAHALFDGVLDIKPWGADPELGLWDPISTWMGVECALLMIADQPDYMHKLVARLTEANLSLLDQLEDLGLFCGPQSLIHCTGAYTDELPSPNYNPAKPQTKDLWMKSQAQMFCTVSPRMFKEFEVDYISRICDCFGLVYYGCCDPLDGKMREVRMIPNVRKVSMSPWVKQDRGAAEIGTDYVFSRKPSPALLACDTFSPDQVRADLLETRTVCKEHGCPLEIILKDISTVRYEPQRLWEWAKIAMQVVGAN